MKLNTLRRIHFLILFSILQIQPVAVRATVQIAEDPLRKQFEGYITLAQVSDEPSNPEPSAPEPAEFSGGAAAEENAARSVAAGRSAEVSEATTNTVVAQLSVAGAACEAVDPEYRADCLATELRAIAQQLPARGGYAAARLALSNASRELARLSRENRDNSQPRLRVTVQGGERPVRRPVSAVKQGIVAATNVKALAILEDTTTALLRSAESDRKLAIHYQRIAQALDSRKVLLRS